MQSSPRSQYPPLSIGFRVGTVLFATGILAALFLGEWRYAAAGAVVWLAALLVLA